MERAGIVCVAACLLLCGMFPVEAGGEESVHSRIIDDVLCDHAHFYSASGLRYLTLGLTAACVLANTRADEGIQDWYREELRSRTTDDVSAWVKPLGNGRITGPVLAGTLVLGKLAGPARGGTILCRWSGRSLRALLLGAPPVLFLQVATGASRPREGDSRWHPFEDDNGVSGHSFVGAVPFLSAAGMTENRLLKSILYAGSALCGLSRINDDAHYLSQSAMGWWLAYLACAGVDRTESEKGTIQLLPVVPFDQGETAMALIITF